MSNQALMTHPTNSPEPGINQVDRDRQEVLVKLLQLEPETLSSLVRFTGWGENTTQRILLQLVISHQLKCVNRDGRRFYGVRDSA